MIGEIKRFNLIGREEELAAQAVLRSQPLSGYLAGKERGGVWVQTLEDEWADTFHVKHAVATNSATSGLLAAAFAIDLKAGDKFACSPMTMSATVAAPMFTGATPFFSDVSDQDFGLAPSPMPDETKAIFTTNLFGHASQLACNEWSVGEADPVYLIEDNAQSPFAMTHNKRYAGTNGTIGIWSLNVHKPIQCGEGGMVTTDDDNLAKRIRSFINHGENDDGSIGLNLRMPEICAAIALQQLRKGPAIEGRVKQAEAIIAAIGTIPGLRPPVAREGCTHVYYTIPFLIDRRRAAFCAELRRLGVPVVEGYTLAHRLPAFKAFARPCPVAEDLQDRRLLYIENCAYDFTSEQINQIGVAFRRAAEVAL